MKNKLFLCLLFIMGNITNSFAQWKTQKITLQPGWNSIYLEVNPFPNQCSTIFKDVAVESVWAWTGQFSVDSLTTDEWLVYHPFDPELTNLFTLMGGKAYRVHYAGETTKEIAIQGKPMLPKLEWVADTFTMAGFHVNAGGAPTFSQFFKSAPELLGMQVLKLNTAGDWLPVNNLSSESINKGEAYWIKSNAYSKFTAPISLELEQANSLAFGRSLQEQQIKIQNHSEEDKIVYLNPMTSETNPNSSIALAGSVALTIWDADNGNWNSLSSGASITVPAKNTTSVRLGINRANMRNQSNALYQSILSINDNAGTEIYVPVSASGLADRAGLWVGTAIIDKVSYVNASEDTPQPTASEFTIRVILHNDFQGKVNLLDEVTQMWKEGTRKTDPDNPNEEIVDEPGKYVLITDSKLFQEYQGAAVRDGKTAGRRLSSPFFSLKEPKLLNGEMDETLKLNNLVLDYDDPLNPFKHQYHPDHNNLDERYENKITEGKESYTVTRSINFEFTTEDPDNLSLPGWGDNQIGGIYKETIRGVHKNPLKVEGTFRLRRVSTINVLNDGAVITPNPEEEEDDDKFGVDDSPMGTEPTKIPDRPIFSSAKLFPNPVNNELLIKDLPEGTFTIAIRDITGQLISRQTYQSGQTINTSGLVSGIYNLEIRNGENHKGFNFIKQSN